MFGRVLECCTTSPRGNLRSEKTINNIKASNQLSSEIQHRTNKRTSRALSDCLRASFLRVVVSTPRPFRCFSVGAFIVLILEYYWP